MSEITELKNSIDKIYNLLEKFLNNSFSVVSPAQTIENKYTLYSWLNDWFEKYKKPKLKITSLRQIQICIDKHIKGNFEDKSLNKISGLDIQEILNKILSSRMKKYTHDVLKAALKQAYKLKLISEDVSLMVDSVNHKRETGKALTIKEQRQFLKAIKGNKLENLYLFYLLSGCRKSEALNIKWSDVDYKKKLIHIKGTKTEKSDRYIPLFPQIYELLKLVSNDNEYIFPFKIEMVKSNFARLKEKYKNLNFKIHDLRHTFATRRLENGISINSVQKWLGHSKPSITSDVYTHVSDNFEKQEIKKYDPKIDF